MAKKILVIDDDATCLKMVDFVLKKKYSIKTIQDAEKGIEIAKQEQPDLILLDIMMPKLNGYETLEKLQADKLTKKIPVIMLTAKEKMEDVEQAMMLGARAYLVKPITSDPALVKKIQEIIGI